MGSGVSTVVKDIGLRVVVKMVGLEVCSVGLRVSMFPVMGFLVGDELDLKCRLVAMCQQKSELEYLEVQ